MCLYRFFFAKNGGDTFVSAFRTEEENESAALAPHYYHVTVVTIISVCSLHKNYDKCLLAVLAFLRPVV